MKFVEPSHFADPDTAARKPVEIANASEACRIAALAFSDVLSGLSFGDGIGGRCPY
jgi:hypothetical protein